jgi:diguanylate cyclase (GGDEF)-like protein
MMQAAIRSIAPGANPLRILVVDDVPVYRKMLARRLSSAGHVVDVAGDGEEAWRKVLVGAFDVLITDRDMPGVDGVTLCHRVREADLASGYVYIIMLTGRDSTDDFVSGLAAGADAYVRKSADPAELLACLQPGTRILTLERRLQKAITTDGYLDVYTRKYFEAHLPREIERAQRYEFPLAVVMADLDRFKLINDEHSHAAGDQALQEFCRRARSVLRQSDWLARYGGEEFVLVLPHTDLKAAEQLAEKVRAECAERPMNVCGKFLAVTVSLGVAALTPDLDASSAASDLLRMADLALYRSKREGRNRVTVASNVTRWGGSPQP